MVYGRASATSDGDSEEEPGEPENRRSSYTPWAELLRRTFDVDVLECPKCHGRMNLIAMIEQPEVIEKILNHLGLPTEKPRALPARPPPEDEQLEIDFDCDDPDLYAE